MKISTMAKSFVALLATLMAFTLSAQSVESYIPADSEVMLVVDGAEVIKNPCTKKIFDKTVALLSQYPQYQTIIRLNNMNMKFAAGMTYAEGAQAIDPQLTISAITNFTGDVAEKEFNDALKDLKTEMAKENNDFGNAKLKELTIDGKKAYEVDEDTSKLVVITAGPRQIQTFMTNIDDTKIGILKPGKAPVTLPEKGILLFKFEITKFLNKTIYAEAMKNGQDPSGGFEAITLILSSADKDVKLDAICKFKDPKNAQDIKTLIDQMLELYKQNPETAAIAGKLKITLKDSTINGTILLTQKDVEDIAEQAATIIMPLIMGGMELDEEIEIDEE